MRRRKSSIWREVWRGVKLFGGILLVIAVTWLLMGIMIVASTPTGLKP